jgi:uncharacterized protein YlxP (DUF503 family)
MVVAVGSLVLLIHDSSSLKAKRRIVKSILGKARSKFDLSIAEVGYMDKWQKSRIGLAVVSNEAGHAHAMLETVLHYVEDLGLAEVVDVNTEILRYGQEFQEDSLAPSTCPPREETDE